jgi:hypothetical protein
MAATLPRGSLYVISSPHGHDSFLIEIRGGMAKRDASISHAERRLRCRRRVERPGADGGEVAAAFTLEIRGYRRCAPRTRLEYVVWTHAAQRRRGGKS